MKEYKLIQENYHYFAYGSNMDLDHIKCWCQKKNRQPINPTKIYPAKLEGYELCFNYFSEKNWQAGAANIMDNSKECVYGLLMCLNESELVTIRKKEGFNNPDQRNNGNSYDEIKVNVKKLDDNNKCSAVTYKAAKDKEKNEHQPPKKEYLDLIIRIAEKYNFPKEYIAELKAIKPKEL